MAHLIDKDALVAEIEKKRRIEVTNNDVAYNGALDEIRYFLNTLEVKEVDLNAAVERYVEQHKSELNGYFDIRRIARHFYELGLQVNNPTTAADRGFAEEIIINLKRVENDYHLDLTREMEWLRNKTKKGE